MSEDLLDMTNHNGKPTSSTLEVPEKFRDPGTGAIRVEALLKSYLELERALSRPAGAQPSYRRADGRGD